MKNILLIVNKQNERERTIWQLVIVKSKLMSVFNAFALSVCPGVSKNLREGNETGKECEK